MQEEKKEKLRQNLENLKERLKLLKETDPTGDYSQIEHLIQLLCESLAEMEEFPLWKRILKATFFDVLHYIAFFLGVCALCGFVFSWIRPLEKNDWLFFFIFPLTSLILMKIMDFFVGVFSKHPLRDMIMTYGSLFLGVGVLNEFCFHFFTDFGSTIFFLMGSFGINFLIEYVSYRHWL